ncbi:MAG: hypothetical protein CVV23_12045 [Ignavibacteriae bacterium HGW-Ignavibacteriae-2]|nr:MAG: hypothetical protein CVV23_12045 [Ignavibacteriae bacterium HGW-Ignavibacteriae-2]
MIKLKSAEIFIICASLIFILLISSENFAQKHQTYFYTESNGLPSSHVNSVIKDISGRVWIGTKNGLVHYDGFSFKSFKEPEISGINIRQLKAQSDGTIWALSSEFGLKISIFNKDSLLKTIRFNKQIPNYYLSAFDFSIKGTDTTIAVISNQKDLMIYFRGKWNRSDGINISGIDRIYNITNIDNEFFLGTNIGLYKTENFKDYEKIYFSNIYDSSDILAVSMSDKTLWISGKDFIGSLMRNDFVLRYKGLLYPNSIGINRYKLIPDYFGKIIVTNEFLTYLIDPDDNSKDVLSDVTGLLGSGAYDLLLDEESILWFASARGISKLPSMRFKIYNKENGLYRNEVTSIVQRGDDNFVLGHFGGLSVINKGRIKRLSFAPNMADNINETAVLDMDIDDNGEVLFTTRLYGLGRLTKDDKIEWIIPTQKINSVLVFNKKIYFLIDRKLFMYDSTKLHDIPLTLIKSGTYLRKLFKSPDNKLYIATSTSGIVEIQNNKTTKVYSGSSKSVNNVYAIYFEEGNTFVGCAGGLYKIVGDSLIQNNSIKSLIDRPVYAITPDRSNNLWFGTDNGLVKWDRKSARDYTTEYGLPGLEVNRDALLFDSQGRLWVGTIKGLGIYQDEFDNAGEIIPSVKFEKIMVGGKNYDYAKTIKLGNSTSNIEFYFNSNSFINENNNTFSVRLEGFDDEWVNIGNKNSVQYSNLPPGIYKLSVKSRNAVGNWSPVITSNSVIISSPFYKMWWFILLLIVCAIMLVYFIYSFLIKSKYAAMLEAEVTKRTEELKNSENKYTTLFMENRTPMLLVDPYSGIIIDGNEASILFYGCTYKDLIKTNFSDLLVGDEKSEFYKNKSSDKNVVRTKQKLQSGTIRDVEIFVSSIEINSKHYNYYLINDITDRILTKKALLETEEKYKSLLENIQDGVFVIQNGLIQYANAALQDMINYSLEEMKGEKFLKFVAPEDREYAEKNHSLRLIGDSNIPEEYELKLLKKDNVSRVHVNALVGTMHIGSEISVIGTLKNITERKQKEDQLKKLSQAVEQSPVAVIITDLRGNIEYVNPKFEEISCYKKQEILGENPRILKYNSDNNRLYSDMWDQITKGEVWRGQFHNKTKDGKSFWVSAVIAPVTDSYGDVTHYLAVEEDITIQKLIGEALRKNEELLITVLNNVPVTIFALNHKKDFVLVKGKVREFLGLDESEILHKNSEFIFSDRPLIKADINIAFEEKSFKKVRKIDNKIFEITYVPIKEFESELVGITGIVYDITERYNSEIAVKESEAKNKAILNALPDLLFEFSKEGIISNYHAVDNSMLLIEKEKFIGKYIGDVLDPVIAKKTMEAIRNASISGEVITFEYSITAQDGSIRHYDSRMVKSDASTYIAIIREITERINYEDQLIQAKNHAEKSDLLKTEFLAQMSHEIRTPINSILSFTGLLREELNDKLPYELKDAFNVIEDGGRRLTRTIDLILNMAQLQTGNFEPNIKKLNIDKDILTSVIQELQGTAKTKGLKLNYNLLSDRTFINGDEYTLGQIFINLIENAIKYTRSGSVDVNVRYNAVDGKIIVDIADTGIGISEDYLPHLFDKFTQEYAGYTRFYEGNGLGLALVKKYVEINDAEISVISQKEKGSTFTVKFNSIG